MGWLWLALVVAITAAAWFVIRLHSVSYRVGSFECAVQRKGRFVDGYACYAVGRLDWYPVASLSSSPAVSWERGGIDITEVSRLESGEARITLVSTGVGGLSVTYTLLMATSAYSGVRSWLESAPPTTASFH